MMQKNRWTTRSIKMCIRDSPHSLQGDKQILEILAQFGAVVNIEEEGITVKKGELNGIRIDARQIPDMVPALAVVAAAATGKTEIVNAERLLSLIHI